MVAEKRTYIFETMPIKKAVIRQIVPAILGQMIALIYNLADTYFVGMLNDPNQTAAIMIVSSPFLLLTAVSNLFGIGGASAISRALGKKQHTDAKQISSLIFWLGLLSGIVVSLMFLAFSTPILKLCGATDATIDYAYGYAKWAIIYGSVFTVLNTLLSNAVRAEGCAFLAAVGVSMGGIINVFLDPFFVLPSFLGYGVMGAGIATAISNLLATGYFVIIIVLRKNGIANFSFSGLRHIKKHISTVLSAGFPSALQYALTVIAVAAQSRFTSAYGAEAVAALGIVKKLDQLPLYFSIGLSTGLLPLLAYNYSAGNVKRQNDAFVFGCIISLSFSLFCLVIYEIFAPILASVFIDNVVTVNYAAAFLRRMVVAMPMMSVCYPLIILFQATGKIKESVICSLLRKGVIDIPLLFLMDSILPLYGITWVQPIVDTISLIVASIFFARILKRSPHSGDLLKG